MTMWLVRAGKAGEMEQFALHNGLAVIGWDGLPDLSSCIDRQDLMAVLLDCYPTERRRTLSSWQHQIWPIRETMQVGDLVALPLKGRAAIAFGIIAGDYAYRTDLPGGPLHTRPVDWVAQVPRSELDPDLLFSFGAFMTVCRISRNDAEQRIRATLDDNVWPAASSTGPAPRLAGASNLRMPTPERSPVPLAIKDLAAQAHEAIRERIGQRFRGHRLAELVAALLELEGYRARLSPPGSDGGVDILAGRGPLGLDPPRLVVQVKSQDTKLDVRILREVSGVMTRFQADQGLLVGWGGFNQVVRAEALPDFFRLRLWDADDIVTALIAGYTQLPDGIRKDVPLQTVWTLQPDVAPAAAAAAAPAAPVATSAKAEVPHAAPVEALPTGRLWNAA